MENMLYSKKRGSNKEETVLKRQKTDEQSFFKAS